MSIKKPLIGLVIFGLLFTGFSLSETTPTWWEGETISQSDTEMQNSVWSKLGWVYVRFCNNWLEDLTTKVSWTIWQMEKWKICIVAQNDTSNDVTINFSFFSTSVTDAWHTACNQTMENVFGSFIDTPQIQLDVPAWEYIVHNFNIQFPLWIEWKQEWCLFYTNADAGNTDRAINIIVWKAMFLEYFVWDPGEVVNDLQLKILKKEIVNNELIIEVWAENQGNIDLKTELQGSLTNIFKIKKDFSTTGEVVKVNETFIFPLNFGQLPNYKWLFNIDITAKHAPHFNLDISNFKIDESVLAEKETSISSFYFAIPWVSLIIILVIIILIILATRKGKQKVLYVEKEK